MQTDRINKTRQALVNDTASLRRDVNKIATDVKEHATAHVDFVKDRANTSYQQANNYVRGNPLQFILAAFFLGYVLGRSRRS